MDGKTSDKTNDKRQWRKKYNHKKKFSYQEKRGKLIQNELDALKTLYDTIESTGELKAFEEFPLCENTKKGLKEAKYDVPTEIQRESILHALRGNDILGAAKTGSGKTLAFLIPILELLYRKKWNKFDGLGALIISPTRELALQIFEVLRQVGKFHDFSAGYVTGGKHLREEAERILSTNIVICTPGRLLQHMDETPYFSADNLQILVLDEADRCLDGGFQEEMNAIIQNLPKKRQTLLFSATQTKSVKDLARLSLKEPMYVSVHEHSQHSTPSQLRQSYIVCELHEKLDMLWSFVKNHLKSKVLVFIQSCKQVRFIHEIFRHLRPGTTVLCLHGAMKHMKRVEVYQSFCRKEHAVLFATDIAARGLDFPAVNWVLQLDCPEDASTYIHRVGRTARYEKDGEALLVLLPSEEGAMVQRLKDKKIPVESIKVNPKKLWSIKSRVESFCAADVQLKEFAQRAFVAYIKSVALMKDKNVFDVSKLDTDAFANSLGLAIPPRIRFLKKREEKFNQKIKTNKSAQELINKLTNTVPNPESSEQSVPENECEEGSDREESTDEGSVEKSLPEGGTSQPGQCSDSSDSEESEGSTEDTSSEEETNANPGKHSLSQQTIATKKKDSAQTSHCKLSFDIGEADISDIFTIKTSPTVQIPDIVQTEETDEVAVKKKTKILTKVAAAKKALKKNLTVNSKVVFDEDGEEVRNPLQSQRMEADSDDEDEGGLDLLAAQQRMRKEDVRDKEMYRQRVKAMHKEKRLKERKKRKEKKQNEESDEDDEPEAILDSTETGSALDFLPDPDKVYGSGNSESDMESEEEDDEDDSRPAKKRRTSAPHRDTDESGSSDDDEEEDITEGISLHDQEALALKLLS